VDRSRIRYSLHSCDEWGWDLSRPGPHGFKVPLTCGDSRLAEGLRPPRPGQLAVKSKVHALTTRVWGAGKLLLLGGALLLTYVLFAAAAMRVALKTRDVVVPSLLGKTVNEASASLSEARLSLKVEEGRRVDPKVPVGQILAQEPQTGMQTRRQRSVRVWVSAGPRSTIVPALVGESERMDDERLARGVERRDARDVVRQRF
jgi:hypothetical protein